MNTNTSPRKGRVQIASLLAMLGLIICMAFLFPPGEWLPLQRWGAELESAGLSGMLAFLFGGMLATSVGLPRQLVAFVAGLAYGLMPGLLLALLAALAGCYLTIRMSRRFLFEWVSHRYPAFIRQLEVLLQHDVFLKVIVLRLQPLGTNLLTNVCIGVTGVSRRTFLLATAIGYVPQMLIFVLLGSGVRVGSDTQMLLSGILLIVSALLGVVLYRLHRSRRTRSA